MKITLDGEEADESSVTIQSDKDSETVRLEVSTHDRAPVSIIVSKSALLAILNSLPY